MPYLVEMEQHRARQTTIRRKSLGLLLLAFLAVPAAPALSGELVTRRLPSSQLTPGELIIQQNIQRREAFQNEQQRLRELDRRTFSAPQPAPRVPIFRRSCQTQVYGSKSLQSCN